MTPKTNAVTSADGRKGGLERCRAGGELGALWRPARPGAAWLPAVRPSLRHLPRFTRTTRRRPEIAGALEAQGLHPAEQINLSGFAVDEPNAALGNAIKLSPRGGPAGPGSSQRCRRFADRRRGKASLRRRGDAARKILSCARVAQFIPSLRARPRSNYDCAWGDEGKEAFIVGDYRGEYWR